MAAVYVDFYGINYIFAQRVNENMASKTSVLVVKVMAPAWGFFPSLSKGLVLITRCICQLPVVLLPVSAANQIKVLKETKIFGLIDSIIVGLAT